MFDRLIESDTEGPEFKNRSRYFLVSSVVVGALFITAVVYSLYATEVALGSDNFDFARLIAPPDPANEPEPRPEAKPPRAAPTPQAERTIRNAAIARVDEPTHVPTQVSNVPAPSRSRPAWDFILDPAARESDFDASGMLGVQRNTSGTSGRASSVPGPGPVKPTDPPPPQKRVERPNPPVLKISSLINGRATHLPKPNYPTTARAMNLSGDVSVQVTIDEKGKVISARVVKGHPFFIAEAERAARAARFNPTVLNDQPVKVTGVILYRFTRN